MKTHVSKGIGEQLLETLLYLLQFRWIVITVQIVMILLKVVNIIDSWWIAFLPTLITIVLPIVIFGVLITIALTGLFLLICGLGILILWDKIETKKLQSKKRTMYI